MTKLRQDSVSNASILFSRESGLSILEILIAITILSFIMIGVISITNNSLSTKERTLSEDSEYLQLETALSRFDLDFSQVYSPLYFSEKRKKSKAISPDIYQKALLRYSRNERFAFDTEDNFPVPIFTSEKSPQSFTFLTASNRRRIANTSQSNFAWVRYSLRPMATTPPQMEGVDRSNLFELVRTYSADNVYSNDDEELKNAKTYILFPYIKTMLFSYWNPQKEDFVDDLQLIPNGKHLLRSVRIDILWINKNGQEEITTRIFRPLWPKWEGSSKKKKNNISPL